jgi:cell wall-associated NlpC family hydrolase
MSAVAAPTSASKRDKAVAVKAQIDRLDTSIELAAEDYDAARARLAKIQVDIRKEKARIAKATKQVDALQADLNSRASSMYRSGPVAFIEVLLQAKDFAEFASTWDTLRQLNVRDARDVIALNKARAEAKAAQKALETKERSAQRDVRVMADRKSSIESQLAERKQMLHGLEKEIAALQAAEDAAAAARARAAAEAAARAARSIPVVDEYFPPPTRAARSEVVSVAMRYLGAPYSWGASGPNSFDCSGFTMFVYAQVGVSLPHNSGAQFGSGERVPRGALQPGDLVFFGSPIHHVGIYVGGGSYIHAPHTGDVVSISPLDRSDYAGAVRP